MVSALDRLERCEPLPFAGQDEDLVTYAEKIGPAERLLDPARPAGELERVVRALSPHIGARVALPDGTLLGVRRAVLASRPDLAAKQSDLAAKQSGMAAHKAGLARQPNPAAHEAVYADDGRLLLGCADGALELLEVQPPGRRWMDAGAFLRGHGLSSA